MIKLLFILLAVPFFGYTQTEKPKSKIESVSARAGVLLKKSFTDLGKVKSIEFQLLELTDLSTKATTKGLRISTPETGSGAGTAVTLMDEDEVDGLLIALQQFKDLASSPDPGNNVEYVFTSRTGFKAILYNYKSKWQFNIKVDMYNSRSQPYWEGTDELESTIELVTKAKAEMKL